MFFFQLTIDDYVQEVRKVCNGMSERDRRLSNFAKIKIEEKNLKDCQITVEFQDQEPLLLSREKTTGKVFMCFNGENKPQMVWNERGLRRNVQRFFVYTFELLINALARTPTLLAIA